MDAHNASALRSNSLLPAFTRQQDNINLNSGERIEWNMMDRFIS
jgi:hypothetical protein